MKKLFILVTAYTLIFSAMACQNAYAGFETDFSAFKIGDSDSTVATFTYLGEKKTLSVGELKDQLKALGYGRYFANDEKNAGYTSNVERAFKEYATSYEEQLKAAERELNNS